MTIKIEKWNESFLRVYASSEILQEIKEFFTFKAPGYRWHPKFKAKLWNGDISLFNMATNKLPLGLHDLLLTFIEKSGEEFEYISNAKYSPITNPNEITHEEIEQFVDSLRLSNDKGEPITAKDYQLEAAHEAINTKRMTLSMPTGSGKSLTIYIIIRYLLSLEKRTCLIVPSVSLVKQMMSDFVDYSIINGFDMTEITTLLFSGQEKNFENPILISTWQSLSKMMKLTHGVDALNSYDGIIVDEAHCSKGSEIRNILEKATEVQYKIGTTGTIDKDKLNELMIIGCLGPIRKIISTKELMDSGNLSDMIIKGIVLQYEEEQCRIAKTFDYQAEIDFLCLSEKRNSMIANLACASKGATIVLCNYVEKHLIPLTAIIEAKAEKYGKNVYVIHGGISPDERERIRKTIMTDDDAILVSSYGTCQQGLNIPNLQNVIFASPSKSSIRVLQSIGRGLRKHSSKAIMTLIDIIDDLRYKKHENTTFKHFLERMKIYRSEKFDVTLKEIKL